MGQRRSWRVSLYFCSARASKIPLIETPYWSPWQRLLKVSFMMLGRGCSNTKELPGDRVSYKHGLPRPNVLGRFGSNTLYLAQELK